jgi:hypothetical protein
MNPVLKLRGVDLYEIHDIEKAKKNRLPSVSRVKPSLFYFLVSYDDGYHGAAEICITPAKSNDDQNLSYDPVLRFTPCSCSNAPQGRMEEECQKVYDTCIRPIHWVFKDEK